MMKRILSIALPLAFGQTSKELLRDGLFAEESEGDLKTATEKYEALLKAFEKERKVAATALFPLASVKRKQADEKAALALYEEFASKFADMNPKQAWSERTTWPFPVKTSLPEFPHLLPKKKKNWLA